MFVIPEGMELIHTHMSAGNGIQISKHKSDYQALSGECVWSNELQCVVTLFVGDAFEERLLKDISGWLVVNSMRSEKVNPLCVWLTYSSGSLIQVQFNLLSEQTVHNVWRKRAFHSLVDRRTSIGASEGHEPARFSHTYLHVPIPHWCQTTLQPVQVRHNHR